MAAVTICSDFGAQKYRIWHCFHCFPIYLPWSDGTRCHNLSFLNVEPGHGGEVWQNVVHWRREWQNTSVFLLWEPHEQYEKAKWYDERWTPQVGKCPRCYWKRVKNNSRKNEEMEPKQKQCLVVDVTDDGSKVLYYKEQYWKEPGMIGMWIKVNWKWSNRRCQEWTLTF